MVSVAQCSALQTMVDPSSKARRRDGPRASRLRNLDFLQHPHEFKAAIDVGSSKPTETVPYGVPRYAHHYRSICQVGVVT